MHRREIESRDQHRQRLVGRAVVDHQHFFLCVMQRQECAHARLDRRGFVMCRYDEADAQRVVDTLRSLHLELRSRPSRGTERRERAAK